jgi:hypothetical protein
MPIARFQMPDGRVARFEVPDGTSPERAQSLMEQHFAGENVAAPATKPDRVQMFKDELMTSLPGGLVRGVKDVIDTGAGLLAKGYDKVTGGDRPTLSSLVTGEAQGEAARVRAMNDAGKADYAAAQQRAGAGGSDVTRVGGQILATTPFVRAAGAGLATLGATRLGTSLASSGMTTGAPAATNALGRAVDLGIRTAGGAAAGGIAAGMVDPESVGTGAAIGAALPGALKVAGAAGGRRGGQRHWTRGHWPCGSRGNQGGCRVGSRSRVRHPPIASQAISAEPAAGGHGGQDLHGAERQCSQPRRDQRAGEGVYWCR